MQPTKIDNRQEDIFRGRLSNELNPKHEMMILSRLIPWDSLEVEFADLYHSNSGGQPPKPIRSQTMEKILSLTVFVAVKSEAVKVNDLKKVIVDTTVMPKNIEFPTDSKLYDKARERLVKLAAKNGIALRQNHNLVAKTLLRKISGYLHGKQMKRARKAIKHLKTIVGRVVRAVERKINFNSGNSSSGNSSSGNSSSGNSSSGNSSSGNSSLSNFNQENSRNAKNLAEIFTPILTQTKRLLTQQRKDKNKLYSLHEPDVACISKARLTRDTSLVVRSRLQQLANKVL